MEGAVEVLGLDTLWPQEENWPEVWRPGSHGMLPEPEMLRLTLRFKGEEYRVRMARSTRGHEQLAELGDLDIRNQRVLDAWVVRTSSWWVRVIGPNGGSFFSSPYATVEAGVLGALSMPAEVRKMEQRMMELRREQSL